MSKVIVTKTVIDSCEQCDFRRSIIPFDEQLKRYVLFDICHDPLKCTRKRPHKPIPDSGTIPDWCPLSDSSEAK